ncbi:MAG: PD-(D/E)XK nuclease family protein [bacterium]
MDPGDGRSRPGELNRLAQALSEVCRERRIEEKWLLAPSVRVGFQWVDRVARSGQPVVNVRVKTLRHMAMELAAPAMDRLGATFLRGQRAQILAGRVLGRLAAAAGSEGYLTPLKAGPGLLRTLLGCLRDLRLAGKRAAELAETCFEVEAKGKEIRFLLAEYERELEDSKLLDDADALREAAARLRRDPDALPADARLLLPADALGQLRALERLLWDSVPEASKVVLECDLPARRREGDATDAALLSWVLRPAQAPAPAADGTVKIFRAVGEANEVREVLRRCAEERIPLDEVEILHPDSETYVPLLYERAWLLVPEDRDAVPMSFAEGIPPRYSRPARALTGWLAWIREDYPQSVLVRMVQDGLLELGEGLPGFTMLGAILRSVPIGGGRERYLDALEREIAATEVACRREEDGARGARAAREDAGDEGPKAARRLGADPRERLSALRALRSLAGDLLACEAAAVQGQGGGAPPGSGSVQRSALEGALRFLDARARRGSKLDEYVHAQLVREIRDLGRALGSEDLPGLDVHEWLAELSRSAHVLGLGPRPGCLHVAPLSSGGHSGRKHTFIVGLDDTRFPGAGLQDPLLLDGERARISADLPTSARRLARSLEGFSELLARLRGKVTLSYCCRSLSDDREMFPSPVVVSAYRILSGDLEADLEKLVASLPEPACFAPVTPGRALDGNEWWLSRLSAAGAPQRPEGVIARHFPHLGRGFRARDARRSDRFTEYDGWVPAAGADHDPTGPDGPVLSASRLEKLGACPMEYFFRYVLGIRPLEETLVDPHAWLQPVARGELLHEVFRDFMSRLRARDLLPDGSRDGGLLLAILEGALARRKGEKPPPSREVFEREARELGAAARIFLLEEEAHCRGSRPLCFEAAIGLPSEGEGTILDTLEPVTIELPGGQRIRARGRIDRVDEVPEGGGKRYAVWDYKTGSTWKYAENGRRRRDPFHQGRVVQSALYLALAEARLQEAVCAQASVSLFGYFFPARSAHGERILWSARELAGGGLILARLCEMMRSGCFPFSDDPGDVSFSEFREAFGDPEAAARAVKRKLENPANRELAAYRALRGPEGEEQTA